ncbi:MAG TPA: hypothetical protein DEF43_19880 [Chloroflexus aurantiacus]|nr:MAG: hypothetical protein D6716_17245 [Chloroflexota bacterium]HBW69363.1 hypothetical protein [Chloroflexus aurantiacus]
MLPNVADSADAGSVSGKMIGTSTRVLSATGRETDVSGQVVGAPEARAPRADRVRTLSLWPVGSGATADGSIHHEAPAFAVLLRR